MPLAPGLFSTMTCVPRFVSSAARMRTYWSVPPPAAKGTTILVAVCAWAEPVAATSPNSSPEMNFR